MNEQTLLALLGPSLHSTLPQLAPMILRYQGQHKIAAFDFDNTIIRGDLSETMLTMMDEVAGGVLVPEYERQCESNLKEAYVQLVHTLVAGKREDEVYAMTEAAYAWGASKSRLSLRPGMPQLLTALQVFGWEVWIVTASPTAIVRTIARRLGVSANRVLGMSSMVDNAGRFLPTLIEPIPYREGKGELLRQHAGLDATFAAGDSQYDLGILQPARYTLLIDRGDTELRDIAHRSKWWILED